VSVVIKDSEREEFTEQMRNFLANESGGFEGYKVIDEDKDKKVMDKFNETIKYIETVNPKPGDPPGRYQVSLPWIDNPPELPSNFGIAIGRLRNNLRKLKQRPDLLRDYDKTMLDQIKSGILEKVYINKQSKGSLIHYLAHQAVIKSTSLNTKLRIVFDASAGYPCLNDLLEKGKVYAGIDEKGIGAIIARVRAKNHIMCMDLEKAFLQILLDPKDRDVTRILWPKSPWNSTDTEIYRFTRITFGLTCSPFLLGATIEHHLNKNPGKWNDKLILGSYVDNYIIDIDEPEQIEEAIIEIRELFWSGGFNCRQFSSDCTQEILNLPTEWQDGRRNISLLGVNWDTHLDNLTFKLPNFEEAVTKVEAREKSGLFTKRGMLSVIAGIFDPVGFIAPIILPAKRIQAEAWKSYLKWDDKVEEELKIKWEKVVNEWDGTEISIPRKAYKEKINPNTKYELHGFSDASLTGLGIAIYLVRTDTWESAICFGKALVVPTNLCLLTKNKKRRKHN
jgi:hypothetical protein